VFSVAFVQYLVVRKYIRLSPFVSRAIRRTLVINPHGRHSLCVFIKTKWSKTISVGGVAKRKWSNENRVRKTLINIMGARILSSSSDRYFVGSRRRQLTRVCFQAKS